MTLIFDKLAPPEYMFKRWFKPLLSQFQQKKNNLRRAKNVVFFLFCILVDRAMGGGGGGYSSPPGYATASNRYFSELKDRSLDGWAV